MTLLETPETTFAAFSALHVAGNPLILVNAWDTASAVIIETAGALAIGTTSAGVAWSHGYSDGNVLPVDELLALTKSIALAIGVPLTVDLEGGYSTSTTEIVQLAAHVLEFGAVGINLEDSWNGQLLNAGSQASRIKRLNAEVPGLFINARIDTFLIGNESPSDKLKKTIERAKEFIDAGANGIFVPGLGDLGAITELVDSIEAPVNVMVGDGSPSVHSLSETGVSRISVGMALAQTVYQQTFASASRIFRDGQFDVLGDPIDYTRMNNYFAG